MNNKNNKNKIDGSGGFILLIALLVSSIMLTAGLGISRVIIRQIYMASVQRDSQIALFAADSGIECARYLETKSQDPLGGDLPTKCNGQPLKYRFSSGTELNDLLYSGLLGSSQPNGDANNIFFAINFGDAGDDNFKSCAVINWILSSKGLEISSSGYNAPCDKGVPSGGRIVERTLVYRTF